MRTIHILQKHRNLTDCQAGFSLVSLLVGIGVVGILSAVLSEFANTSMKAARKIAQIGEMEDVRRMIRMRLDCGKTLLAIKGAGKSPSTLPLMASNGVAIAEKTSDFVYKLSPKIKFKATGRDSKTGAITIVVKVSDSSDFSNLFSNSAPVVCN